MAIGTCGCRKHSDGKTTAVVRLAVVMVILGGLMVGYSIGVSGGVITMEHFLKRFFPSFEQQGYCFRNNHAVQLFISSLYLGGIMSSFLVLQTTHYYDKRIFIFMSSICFICGACLSSASKNLPMLITGRTLVGIGVGLDAQCIIPYVMEVIPACWENRLKFWLHMAIPIGIFVADLLNYFVEKIGWGWRLSLGLVGFPSLFLMIVCTFLPKTPLTLIKHSQNEEGKTMLARIRGTQNVDVEYNQIILTMRAGKVESHWTNLFKKKYRPHLVLACWIPLLQQAVGLYGILLYMPQVLMTFGFKSRKALFYNLLIISQGLVGIITQLAVGLSSFQNWKSLSDDPTENPDLFSVASICLISSYTFFSFSLEFMGFLAPVQHEFIPSEISSATQGVSILMTYFSMFGISQVFLYMLCSLEWGLFFLFAGGSLFTIIFLALFFPSVGLLPNQDTESLLLWRKHWFWKRYTNDQVHPIGTI